jgi:hypothetical protein
MPKLPTAIAASILASALSAPTYAAGPADTTTSPSSIAQNRNNSQVMIFRGGQIPTVTDSVSGRSFTTGTAPGTTTNAPGATGSIPGMNAAGGSPPQQSAQLPNNSAATGAAQGANSSVGLGRGAGTANPNASTALGNAAGATNVAPSPPAQQSGPIPLGRGPASGRGGSGPR